MSGMFGVWAVAKHTFRQCLRMKVAALFIVLLAVALTVLPFSMRGDGTLAGRIRTFLSYSTSITAGLLSLVTVFVAVAAVTGDVQKKLIFSVATKPLARWQYILGRWLGVVLLNVLLLAVAGGAIYGLSQYLRSGEALNPTDRRTVETEIFTARNRIAPEPLDIERQVEQRIAELRQRGEYDDVIAGYLSYSPGDEALALERLYIDLRQQIADAAQSVAPGGSTSWRFSGINVAGEPRRGPGRVLRVDKDNAVLVVQADPLLSALMIYSGPVRVDGNDGRIVGLDEGAFAVRFTQEQMTDGRLSRLEAGREVELEVDPIIQITFIASPARTPLNNQLASSWEIQNSVTGFLYSEPRNDAPSLPATLVVSDRVVSEQGDTDVRYYNLNLGENATTSVTILHDDIAVLYQVASFEANLLRAMLLILIQLIFLAALAVLAASFLSFSVACLFTLFLLIVQWGMSFLLEASNPKPSPSAQPGWFDYVSYYIVLSLKWLLPGSNSVSPSEALVDGMQISLTTLGGAVLRTSVVTTALLLVMACLIFRKRELARVQV